MAPLGEERADGASRAPLPARLHDHYIRSGLWDDTSLGRLLIGGLRRYPDQQLCVWSPSGELRSNFATLETLSRQVAAGLGRRGVRAGDRVVYWLPNGVEAAAVFVGLAALGAVLVPVAAFYGRKDVVDIVNCVEASVVIVSGRHGGRDYIDEIEQSRTQMPTLHTIVVCKGTGGANTVSFDELACAPPLAEPSVPCPDDPCLLSFTSGTGGAPKGVIHTHRSIGAEVRHHLTAMVPPGAAPQMVTSPIAHAAGMTLGLLAPIHQGRPVHLSDTFDVDYLLDTARAHRLAPGGGAAVFLSAVIDHPGFTDELVERMRYVILGGSTVPETLVAKAAARGLAVLRCYGLTEHPTVSAGRLGDAPSALRHTDGQLLDGVEVQLRGSDGAVLGAGSEGQIFTRGPDRCAGYLQSIHNAAFDSDGWLGTGDLGVLNSEGYLAVTGRVKDMIIRNGVKITPAEVENVLMTCPAVADVAVIGVPDARTGERAVAVVITRGRDEITLSTLTAHLANAGVAKPKWPEEMRLVDDLPRTASGKVRKNVLRAAWPT